MENKVAAGEGTFVQNDSEISVGRFNKSTNNSDNYGNEGNTAFSIGIGTSNSNRKNAVEVMQNGDVYVNGIGEYDGTNPSDSKDLATYLPNMVNVTYIGLKTLKDAGNLVPGQQYRITDYTCTTTTIGTKSAGHDFDIIVTADSESVLNEEARAIQHDFPDDTEETVKKHFANNDLKAWKIWYCFDNDTTRFDWANELKIGNVPVGRGVIYRMIDEFNNDVPYDFKNIQFKYTANTDTYPHYYYTFASDNVENNTDYSLNIANSCFSNTISGHINNHKMYLNRIIFIGNNCYKNTFGPGCQQNFFGSGCYNNSFGQNCSLNIFNKNCTDNTFVDVCSNNVFGSTCYYNVFSSACHNNVFGSSCANNTFGSSCANNTFGEGCCNNSFGASCTDNSFRSACSGNSFGNDCDYNTFGSSCYYNSFGNNCRYIKFASDSSESSIKYNYYQNNHFGDGCQYILFTGEEKASYVAYVQNYNFVQGLQGKSSSNYLKVTGKRRRLYDTMVSMRSDDSSVVYGYCLADLAKTVTNEVFNFS